MTLRFAPNLSLLWAGLPLADRFEPRAYAPGEIIAQATDDHTLIGGHHRLAVAASLGKRLFWRDTGEPVKLDLFFKHHGSSLRHTA